jgi:5'-deoxynucleotidase YfbR-like HD superfamily hydrolase
MKVYKKNVIATVTLHSGAEIDFNDINIDNVLLEDIAHHLSRINRWNGLGDHFFSVAEHSIMTAELAPPNKRLGILMHDCEETITGDNITPLKEMIPFLVVLGDKIRDMLLEKFNVPYDKKLVQYYDHQQLLWELDNIINSSNYKGLSPEDTEKLFLRKFVEYSGYLAETEQIVKNIENIA